ncbi:MAG: ABC transporter permease, partial [Prevotellaceae bacterium]|nr:ABC transporter permease [Prevotellaceae bacterium]
MIAHYLTLALRNLWKYRTQSIISVAGLAVGFVCFALANLWIHYEMTFDADRAGIDRTYLLYNKPMEGMSYGTIASYKMGEVLRSDYPEVEAVCATNVYTPTTVSTTEGVTIKTTSIDADSAFIAMYGSVRLLAGSWDFLHQPDKAALTEETAIALFGTTDVLGKTVKVEREEQTVCAVLNNQPRHSNFYFGYWKPMASRYRDYWGYMNYTITVRLRPGTDVDAFTAKIRDYQPPAEEWGRKPFEGFSLMPLTEYHYSELNRRVVVHFRYLVLFSVVGTLIILCALLNYLSLFVVRMRNRVREGELRRVCGSSRGGLFVLFVTEYLWVLLIAGLIGMAIVEWVLPEFRRLSGVSGGIYAESLLYFAGLLLLSFLFLLPFVWRRQRPATGPRKHLSGKVSIVLQLVISMGFIFCVGVLMKQLHYLKTTDIGWERRNTGVIFVQLMPPDVMEALKVYVGSTPYIRESVTDSPSLFPVFTYATTRVMNWDGKEGDADNTLIDDVTAWPGSPAMLRFYNMTMVAGNWVEDNDPTKLVVNETLLKKMGMTDPVGKRIQLGDEWHTIAGVVKDFHTEAPTVPAAPAAIYFQPVGNVERFPDRYHYLIKFEPGSYPQISADMDSILARHG